MKQLILIRHAKAESNIPGIADYERPLSSRGYSDAMMVANELATGGIKIQRVLTSHAVRAYSTALIFARVLDIGFSKFEFVPELYASEVGIYLSVLKKADDRINTIALFAHNPEISEAIGFFTGNKTEEVPTCAVTILESKIETWNDAKSNCFVIKNQIIPKALKAI
jgi:phosphohistidine phosphatase